MNDALVAAEQAKQEIINSTKADAETIRSMQLVMSQSSPRPRGESVNRSSFP